MTDDQLKLLLDFLQRIGLLRRAADVEQKVTLYQFPSLSGTATFQTTLLDILPSRRPVSSAVLSSSVFLWRVVNTSTFILTVKTSDVLVADRKFFSSYSRFC